jgi:phosphonate transport system permease protein
MAPKPANSSVIEAPAGPDAFFRRIRRRTLLVWLVVLGVAMLSGVVSRYDVASSFTAIPRVLRWMAANLLPDARALTRLPSILAKLADTVLVSVMATVTATVAAFALGLLGSRTTRPHPAVAGAARLVASVMRNIPVVAWAMILLLSFGQSSFTGFLALTLETFGFLARAFMETIDETSEESVEALRAAGATYGHTIFQAVLPSTLPQIVSWMLYMLETNIRSATLVGILTGTGIGFAFDLYYKSLSYPSASLVTLCVVVVVLAIEVISNAIRRRIL